MTLGGGVGVGEGVGVGVGVGVEFVITVEAFQKPPLSENVPPVIVFAALSSPTVPSILKGPPELDPPPPAITCGSI